MNKGIRRVLSCVAVMCMVMGTAVQANADPYPESADWSARRVWVANAGAAADVIGRATVKYSTYGANIYCNSVSHSVNGATGTININCVKHTMPAVTITDIGSAWCNPSVSGGVDGITYTFGANTNKLGDIFICSGTVVAILD